MKYELFTRVALNSDVPRYGRRSEDVATVIEHHTGQPGQEPGYSLEAFSAVRETVAVVTVRESQIVPLNANELFHVRPLVEASR